MKEAEIILCEENGIKLICGISDKFNDYSDICEVELVENQKDEELTIDKIGVSQYLKEFLKSYSENKNKMELEDWLEWKLSGELKAKPKEEIKAITGELIEGVECSYSRLREVKEYRKLGFRGSDYLGKKIIENIEIENKEEAKEMLKDISGGLEQQNINTIYEIAAKESLNIGMGITAFNKMDKYFYNINETIAKGNEELIKTITTKAGDINMNPNLDGFIAEHFHANTFNLDATLKEISNVRADVLVPEGSTFGKNSVDITVKIIEGSKEKVIQRIQVKYSSTSESTQKLFEKGNYHFQRKLVPEGQGDIGREKIKYGKTESDVLSKNKAKEIQKEIQKGNVKNGNLSFKNDVEIKKLSKQIGKQSLQAGVMAVGIGLTASIGKKLIFGEKIEADEIILDGIKSGGSIGLSTAIAGGLKASIEKGYVSGGIKNILKSNSIIGTVAFSTIGVVSIAYSIGTGDMKLKNGVNEIGNILTSTYAGIKLGSMASIGAIGLLTVGSVLAPVIGVVAGTVGYLIGNTGANAIYKGISTIGETVVSGVKNILKSGYNTVKSVASGVWEGVKSVASSIDDGIKSFGGWISSWF